MLSKCPPPTLPAPFVESSSCAAWRGIAAPQGASCKSTEDYDGGLCYPKCRAGYYGVGPVRARKHAR
jgi:hypothetical protein